MGICNVEQELQMDARMLRHGFLQKTLPWGKTSHFQVNYKEPDCSCRVPDLAERGRDDPKTRKTQNDTLFSRKSVSKWWKIKKIIQKPIVCSRGNWIFGKKRNESTEQGSYFSKILENRKTTHFYFKKVCPNHSNQLISPSAEGFTAPDFALPLKKVLFLMAAPNAASRAGFRHVQRSRYVTCS